jgi:Zn-dependent M28 family amino/carboxypeptidase
MTLPTAISTEQLIMHVQMLAGEIGERNTRRPRALRAAEEYIQAVWNDHGYDVTRQEYRIHDDLWANLEVTRRGRAGNTPLILLGAHYDSVMGSPGANDNGTGVAALLELSRVFSALSPEASVRFVAFVNEEPPYFLTPAMGSRVYAEKARDRGDKIAVMVSLETMGYYSEEPGSQKFPFPSVLFEKMYPDRGNFIAFASNIASRAVMREAVALFRSRSKFPVESIATLEMIPGINWSDHASFWQVGYPAFMVTDTAPYRYPYYHTPQDTPDRVNYDALTRVTQGLAGMFQALAS